MIIRCVAGGPFLTNCYILGCEETGEGLLVDPGIHVVGDALEEIERFELTVKKILNTHAHVDHASGVDYAKQALGAEFYLHPKEEAVLKAMPQQARRFPECGFGEVKVPKVDHHLEDGEEIEFGKIRGKVIHTPGHTYGSICISFDGDLISGDTLFAGSVGRVDLTGGTSMRELIGSIKKKLLVLDPSTKVYSGHGPVTTIGTEKDTNPFIAGGLIIF